MHNDSKFSHLLSYLKHQILPVAKFSFYSGNVTFSVIQNVFNLYERCKELLDTNGNGWADPISDFSQFTFTVEPLAITKQSTDDDAMKSCANLAMNQNDDDNEEDMLVALPKMETEEGEELATIWLPLKRKHIFNINSKTSAFILFRYYVMVTQCYSYQGINQSIFNRKLKLWLVENVLPYLEDENLYPAFGAVLRILETIKEPDESGYHGTKQKAVSRWRHLLGPHVGDDNNDDNVFDVDTDDYTKWLLITFAALAGPILLLLTCCAARVCSKKNRDNHVRKPNCFQRCMRFLRRNSHQPDGDEFYQYKKLSTANQNVVFEENEKKGKCPWRKQKGKKTKSKEKFNLPRLGRTSESDEDVVLLDTKKGKKSASNASFKISESSDEGKKPPKRQVKPDPPGLFTKFRSRSPQPKAKPRSTSDD